MLVKGEKGMDPGVGVSVKMAWCRLETQEALIHREG